MAFQKFANANILKPDINIPVWDRVRDSAQALGSAFATREASKMALAEYTPKDYMLSHCTIVASVDTEHGSGEIGRHMENGYTVNRLYSDYLITPKTAQFVNNNNDSWERKLLLSSFRTFIGGENYVEHLQIPEMSKGKIIDAAARDIGDSVYIDILVATHRKHRPLIAAINSGSLQTLSMGCFLPHTQVSLADGRRVAIQEVQPGDEVLTHKGRSREVLNLQVRHGVWGMRTIKAVGLSDVISSTDNHPFYVIRPYSFCACGCGEKLPNFKGRSSTRRLSRRFKIGHDKNVFNPNNTYSLSEYRERKAKLESIKNLIPVEVRADELQEGDLLCIPRSQVLSNVGDLKKAELLGYFLAEGSFLKHKGKRVEVQFNFSLDEKDTLVARTIDLLKEAFPEANPAWVQIRENRSTATVHVTGGGVAEWFYSHGGEYSHLKTLSPDVFLWDHASQTTLLRAWLQGDGGVRKKGGWVGTTTSYNLACQLSQMFANIGVHVRFEGVLDQKAVSVSQAVNGGQVVTGHNGKKAYFNLCLPDSQVGFVGLDRVGKHTQHLRVTDTHVLRPIKSIESFDYEGWVYDLEVEEDHSYLVEGVAVHNCNVQFTVCTKCGNVAKDETELCPHIKYEKGNNFIDSLGQVRKVAELCGHVQDEPGSVKFIEASWVANPAFTGAVLRNILTPEEAEIYNNLHQGRVQIALSEPARTLDPHQMARAARMQPQGFNPKVGFDFGQGQGQEDEFGGASKPKEEKKSPMDKAVEDLAEYLRDQAVKKVREQLAPQEALNENLNDTIIKEASKHPAWRRIALTINKAVQDPLKTQRILLGLLLYKSGGWRAVKEASSFSGQEVLAISKVLDTLLGVPKIAGEARVYRTVLAVGGSEPYGDEATYLAACRRVLGRELTNTEKTSLVVKGKLFDFGH